MLLYYDKYIDSGYVDDGYREQKKWQAFTDKLISYIQPNQVGANTQDIVNGVNEYLKDRGMKAFCKYACENENKILVEKIRDNKPIILNLFGHPTYKDHAVVAEGYFISYVGKKYTYASINDGAGLNRYKGKRMYVNMEYAGTVVYLK